MYCLLCLKKSLDGMEYIDAYSAEGLRLNISGVINKHFWLQTGQSTKHVCKVCWNIVYKFHSFYRSIVQVHNELLIDYMKNNETFKNELTTSVKADGTELNTKVQDHVITEQLVIKSKEALSINSNENQYNKNGISDIFEPQIFVYEESTHDHIHKQDVQTSQRDQICNNEVNISTDILHSQIDYQEESACDTHINFRERIPVELSFPKVKRESISNLHQYEYSKEVNETVELYQNSNLIDSSQPNIYRCDTCNHVSTTVSALKSHKYFTHVCLKKFKCSMCTKSFKRKQYLTEHLTVHTGAYLYLCTICETKFKAKSNLFHHLKRKHNSYAKDGFYKSLCSEFNV